MRKLPLLLAFSLAANAALLVTFFLRPVTAGQATVAIAPPAGVSSKNTGPLNSAQLSALASGDLAQLKAADLPDDIARNLVVGRAYNRLLARQRAASKHPESDGRYWRNPGLAGSFAPSKEQRAEMNKAGREFGDALRAVGESPDGFAGPPYSYLPAAKGEQLRRIGEDYGEMQSEIYINMSGIQLPSDREKLKLLRAEQERDIAAALTPEEFEQYSLRSSQTTQTIRSLYGDAIQTEGDFKRIFTLQKAFDDQYSAQDFFAGGPPSREAMAAYQAAAAKLQDDIAAAIGADNLAAFRRASDQEYKTLTAVAQRLNLPENTADSIYATRDTYAAQSQQINQNASLSAADRRAQLKSLADQARADLQSKLGAEGADVYIQRANWLNLLQSGTAFSTNPKDAPAGRPSIGTTVYLIPAPRPSPPGGG